MNEKIFVFAVKISRFVICFGLDDSIALTVFGSELIINQTSREQNYQITILLSFDVRLFLVNYEVCLVSAYKLNFGAQGFAKLL